MWQLREMKGGKERQKEEVEGKDGGIGKKDE